MPVTYTTRTTDTDVVEITVELVAPAGLASYTGGTRASLIVDVEVSYSPAGQNNWQTPTWLNSADAGLSVNGRIRMEGAESSMIRRAGRWSVPAGQYDVRVGRTTAELDPVTHVQEVRLAAIRTAKAGYPVLQAGLSLIALRMKASGQLNGVPQTINCIAESYLPVWNGTAWAYEVSRNPAWAYADILRRRGGEPYMDDSRIDLEAISDWADACAATAPNASEPRWTFDAVLEGGSVFQALRQIAASARANYVVRDGLYSVVRDISQTTPVQIISPRNSWGYRGAKAFLDLPHGLRVRFVNAEKGYEEDEIVVYDDGYNEGNASKFETLELYGCTSATQAWREGRYHIAVGRLRPEVHSVEMDVENLRCTLGDLVHFQHDAISIGLGAARCVSNSGALVVDQPIQCTGAAMGARARLADGTIVTGSVGAPAAGYSTTFGSLAGVQPGDLVMFGLASSVSAPMIVTRIEPGPNFTARISMVDAQAGVYTADTGSIPPFESNITVVEQIEAATPDQIAILALRSGSGVYLWLSDGTVQDRIAVDLEFFPSGLVRIDSLDVQWRLSSAANWSQASFRRGAPIYLTPVAPGSTYVVRARGVSQYGVAGPWSAEVTHEVQGRIGTPPDVEGLVATASEAGISIRWTECSVTDYRETVIKVGATYEAATTLFAGKANAWVYDRPASATYKFWAYHVNASGVPSANVASYTLAYTLPEVNNADISLGADGTLNGGGGGTIDLGQLAGGLTSSQLATELAARVNQIDAPDVGLVARVGDLETAFGDTQSAEASALAAANSATAAAASQAAAAASESAAVGSAAAALLSQQGAETASQSAETYATNASTSASNASTSATTASSAATSAAGSASTAETHATNAANSANAAGGSASAAATSASNASTYATNSENAATASNSARVAAESARDTASGHASAAASSAQTATTKASEASQSASAASTSATNAATSESNANTYATQASTSATNAAGSESAASTSAGAAAQSAINAGNSASAAASSAQTASTQATNAGNSATAAEASRVAAESSFGGAVRLNGNFDFSQGKTGWSSNSSGAYNEIVATLATGGPTANAKIVAAGALEAYWDRRIPIERTRTYRVRVRVKSVGTTGAVLYAGVATYSADGTLETAAPGTHRYCAAGNVAVPSDGQWHVYEGTITGEGNTTHNQFRTTSAFASPMFIVNFQQGAGYVTEVDECSLTDITESTAAAGYATAAAGSASTATTKANEAETAATASQAAQVLAESARDAAQTHSTAAAGSASTAATRANDAETSATAANNAKVAAESARDTASSHASAASGHANTASTHASNAGSSASSASTSANTAQTHSGNAYTYSQNAASSATSAAGSATQAATSLEILRATATGFDAAYAYNFDSNAEGWTWQYASGAGGSGVLTVNSSSNDPIVRTPTISLNGSKYTIIRARVKRVAGSGWDGTAYYSTGGHGEEPQYSKQVTPDPTALNEWRIVEWDMTSVADWMNSTVTQVRLDLGNTAQDQFQIDWVVIGRVAPLAYDAMIAEERTARIAEDGALASSVSTLSSTVGGHTTTISQHTSSINGINGVYSVKIDNNGVLSGFGLMSTLAANGSVTSDFFIRADTFAVIAPAKTPGEADSVPFAVLGATRTINGVSFQAGVHIHGSAIVNGTLTAAKIDTKGLTIKDNNGNVIFGSGASVDPSSFISAPSGWQNDSASIGGSNFAPNTSFDRWAGARPYQWGVYETVGGSVSLTQGLAGGLFGASYVRCTTNQYISAGHAFGTLTRLSTVPDPGSGIQSWVPGQTYVISFWGRSNGGGMVGQKLTGLPSNMGFASITVLEQPALTTSWQRYSWRVVPNDNANTPYGELYIGWHEVTGAGAGASFDVCCVKVELGRVPTAWVASDRDMRNSSASLGVNILYNGDFSNGKDGWTYGTPSGVTEASNGVNLNSDWRLQPVDTAGADVFYSRQAARAGNNNYYLEWLAPPAAVVAGERYVASAYTGAHRASVEVFVYCYNTSGTAFQAIQGSPVTAMNQEEKPGGQALSGYKRIFVAFTAPAGTSYIRVVLRKYDTYANSPAHEDSYMFVARVMLEQAGGAADAPGPWASAGYTDRTAVRAGNPVTAQNVSTYIEAAAIGSLDIATTGKIRSGKTSYGSGTGFIMEYNGGTPRFDIGDANQYLRWTGTGLDIKLNKITLSATTPAGGSYALSDTITRNLGTMTVTASGGTPPYSYFWTSSVDVEAASLHVFNRGYITAEDNVATFYASGGSNCGVGIFATCIVVDANGLTNSISAASFGTFGTGPP